jgi:hypothetical protein
LTNDHIKRYRGEILRLLAVNHRGQKSRLDHVTMWYSLRGIGCDVGEDDVLTLLQDMCDRGYVRYDETRDRKTNEVRISKIEITSGGRDVFEGTRSDAAIYL